MTNHLHQLRADGLCHNLPDNFGLFLFCSEEDADIYLQAVGAVDRRNKRNCGMRDARTTQQIYARTTFKQGYHFQLAPSA